MSDDLIDRLRNPAFMDMEWPRELFTQCADRIEELEREKASWKGVYDGAVTAMSERIETLEAALHEMLHAVCSPTGFASAVRTDSGKAYPWVTLEHAEQKARAALGEKKDD